MRLAAVRNFFTFTADMATKLRREEGLRAETQTREVVLPVIESAGRNRTRLATNGDTNASTPKHLPPLPPPSPPLHANAAIDPSTTFLEYAMVSLWIG